MAKSSSNVGSRSPMTTSAAARIQGATARASGGHVAAGSFAARAQAAAAQNGGGKSGSKK
jgi:hypothetical protein